MLMLVGAAPKVYIIEVISGITGIRIFSPARSAGDLIGRGEAVIWRKPLSQIFSKANTFALVIADRIWAPKSPSMAAQTVS
jgi:hypothetical protein